MNVHTLRRQGDRRHARGQGLVEMALVLPLVLLLLMTLVDFGRVIFAQNAINQDAREAARVGAVPATAASCGTDQTAVNYQQCQYDWIREAGKRVQPGVTFGDANIKGRPGAVCPAAPDATIAYIEATDANGKTNCFYPTNTSADDPVEVHIKVTVPFITPIISNIVGGSITVEAKAQGFIQCGSGLPKCQ